MLLHNPPEHLFLVLAVHVAHTLEGLLAHLGIGGLPDTLRPVQYIYVGMTLRPNYRLIIIFSIEIIARLDR